MADDHHHGEIIIIKKKVSGGHGHHGGAWKIAFADFMTAMMAFFLVLWIINATDKDTKTVIARYFNPVKLENPAKAKKGVHGSTSAPTEGEDKKSDKAAGEPSKAKQPGGAPPTAKADKKATQPAPRPKPRRRRRRRNCSPRRTRRSIASPAQSARSRRARRRKRATPTRSGSTAR